MKITIKLKIPFQAFHRILNRSALCFMVGQVGTGGNNVFLWSIVNLFLNNLTAKVLYCVGNYTRVLNNLFLSLIH